jgi:eukaryotic-like serine/threonine-protein kinase
MPEQPDGDCTRTEQPRLTSDVTPTAPYIDADLPQAQIAQAGGYAILGEIGRGGMGVVLEALDGDLGRRVAVKVLLQQQGNQPELVQRFLEEAQITGRLQHPGIVPVYQLGRLHDQRPFFSMKLVQGRTLAELLADRTNPADGQERFLAIYEQVCQTLAYAHSRGVIHRDLKPSNIMVGPFGEVQIMDWGLAKVLTAVKADDSRAAGNGSPPANSHGRSDHMLSRTGTVMGTPAYMAPEQACGAVDRIDERTDVFGLGGILCTILTGKPPFDKPTPLELTRQAEQGDLSDAFARLDACGADAELVALTGACLSADPEQRPRDAGVVALRMTEYRAGVQERLRGAELERAAAQARARVERKARRLTAALAAAVLALTILGGGGWLWHEREHAERAQRVGRTEREVDGYLQEAVRLRERAQAAPPEEVALWTAALAAARQAKARLAGDEADEGLRRRVRELLNELEPAEEDRTMLARLEQARLRQAELKDNQFDVLAAGPAYAAAFKDYGIDVLVLPPEETAQRLRERAILAELAAALGDWARLADPKQRERLLKILRLADPDPWRQRLRDALAQQDRHALVNLARDREVERLAASTLYLLGSALGAVGEHAESIHLLRRAQQLYPRDFWLNFQLGFELSNQPVPQPDEAVRFYSAALALGRHTAGVYLGLGNALAQKRANDEAVAAYREAIRLQSDFAIAHRALADVLRRTHHEEEALTELREAIRLKPDYYEAYNNLGVVLSDRGESDEAMKAFHRAIKLKADYGSPHHNLALILDRKGRLDDAIASCRAAMRADPQFAEPSNTLGTLLEKKGRVDEAIESYQQAISLRKKMPRAEAHLAMSYANLALAHLSKHATDKAITELREAIRYQPRDAALHTKLGDVLLSQRQFGSAISAYREAVRLDPDRCGAWINLGAALTDTGMLDEAIAAFREAIRVKPHLPIAHVNLGVAYQLRGDAARAVETFRTAARLEPGNADYHYRLADSLRQAGHIRTAIDEYRKAIERRPDFVQAYTNLGGVLLEEGKYDEAIAVLRQAVRQAPQHISALCNLGNALRDNGDLDGSIPVYREAIRVKPDSALANCLLGEALQLQGNFAEALAMFRRGHELGQRDPKWRYPSALMLRECEHLAALDRKLPAFLAGKPLPVDAADRIEFASLCWKSKQQYAAAARLFAEAFSAQPALAEDLKKGYRLEAARAAAAAAAGEGRDSAGLDDQERARWRKQAMMWLRADLEAWSHRLQAGNPTERADARGVLYQWRSPQLSLLRSTAIDRLPKDERDACRKLWADFDALWRRAFEPD